MDFDFFAALRRMKSKVPVPATVAGPLIAPAVTRARPPVLPGSIGPKGFALIKQFEGCARRRGDGLFAAYPDPGTGAEPWTIGWGATGADVHPGLVWTQQQCDARLAADLARFARAVSHALDGAPTTPGQFDALVSFHYNTGAIAKATLTRLHKAGRFAEAADEFGKWVYAGGQRLPGLIRRRVAEAALYGS